ncbi:imidazolonepropionase [Abyssalbus ytuae]|uniref:Imidazolonepropionase n=1 Tax=Abyssalbus ytuae TaxID=2926907 RepID=A0A9E6ZL31_9FLAO|nr:imidazolonepropionase [Abyssalbus ytuae]UOB17747.1 imidazolonepropionase [Abyssalbus ytuae]
MNSKKLKLTGPFKQIITLAGLPLRGPLKNEHLEIIDEGGILIENDTIIEVGKFESLKHKAGHIEYIEEDLVALPGFIDAHTHICFAGSRARDYAMRNAGKTYLEIAREGGGIWDTVTKTRQATVEELTRNTIKRAEKHLQNGVTTIEVKSGYGLSVEEELKMLRAITKANESTQADLIPTCLAAHILPKDFEGSHEAYLKQMASTLLPEVKSRKLANRVDIFIEEEAFDGRVALEYLKKAAHAGFDITVHADQFSTGGSKIAIEAGAVSADHLEASTNKEIQQLAKSNVIPVALPGASLGLGCNFTPARKLLDAGTSLVIASDWNPGSAPMGNLLTQASILGSYQKLSNAEVLAAITFRAATALKLTDRGKIEKGLLADVTAFPCRDVNEILYHQGELKPTRIWKKGKQRK